jgi:sugar lactone lactonase YvrE
MPLSVRQWVSLAAVLAATSLSPMSARISAQSFPALIELPADFGPEGIGAGNGSTFYVGSLGGPAGTTRGQILAGDLRTGDFAELVAPDGVPATGIKHDPRSNLLFVARAGSGMGTVFDAASGEQVAAYQFQTAPTFINDVVVTRQAAYFTDTQAPFLYRVALGPRGQPAATATRISLPGDFRANGIVATPSGERLLVVNAADARLYRVDAAAPNTVTPVDLGGATLPNADGLLLRGKTLYVVQNRLNRVAVVELSDDFSSGTITRFITEPFASNPQLQVPTTIAAFGTSLYAVTAGFAPPAPDFVVRLSN